MGTSSLTPQERAEWHTLEQKQLSAASAAQAGFRFKSSRRGRRVTETAGKRRWCMTRTDTSRKRTGILRSKSAAQLGYGGCEDGRPSRWSYFSFAVCGGCPCRDLRR